MKTGLKKKANRYLEGARIEREITLKGRLYLMRFDVKSFGGYTCIAGCPGPGF